MNPNRNALIAIVFALLIAAGVAVYRITSIQPLEPPPVRLTQPDEESPAANKPLTEQKKEGREAVPAVAPSGNDSAAAVTTGRVRCQVDVAPGETFPAQYELTVETPSAPPKVLTFTAADRLVALDLPQGRSVLRARAEGLASRATVVVRESDAPLPPIRVALEPASQLGGVVLDAHGAPLAGLAVWLVATTHPDARTVSTDAAGRYEFSGIPVGPYRVAFGASDSPIAPIVPVEVAKGEVRDVPPQNMPELGEGEVKVLDRAGQPVEGARVFGAGQRGGWIDGVSDGQGVVRARFLPAGTFFLNVATESGRTGQGPLEINIGRIGRASIHIRD